MSSIRIRDPRLLGVLALASACASSPKRVAPPQPPPPAPIAKSSIDAVLMHRAELGLTDAQVKKLQDRDAQRERDDADIVRALNSRKGSRGTPAATPRSASSDSSSDPSNVGVSPPGGRGMGGGGRRRGGGSRTGSASAENSPEQLQERLDDDDTAAYLDAEASLTEPQRPRAREVASEYREALWNYQQAQAANPTR